MPRQSHSGIRTAPWHYCDRCGYKYRVTELRRQIGLILCETCFDNPIAWQRPVMIQDLLNFTSEEELRIAEILKENMGDDVTGYES
jgi:hypothetical protein